MLKVRSIFISDVHLGTRACQAERLLDFLRHHECDRLYLVGDIVDFWSMSRSIHWTAAQNTVIQKILRRARHRVDVYYVPGNHDEALRQYVATSFGDIHILEEGEHVTADGRRFLVAHGDAFDQVTKYHRWLAVLGDQAYDVLVRINVALSRIRRTLGIAGYWSLAGYAKRKVKKAMDFIFDFENAVARYARERGFDGVICGHIHAAAHKRVEGVTYINCGDWVDSCTGVIEHYDGRLEVVHWGAASANVTPLPSGEPAQPEPEPASMPLPEPAQLRAGRRPA